ncbi:ORMDL-domain-containing protein [Rozella allomycis CSF55]|uniref:ORMDL-domain-containing protein n=1 Tax=Rozella allomycis (strain CSF55) TaxID=988480 RepID=A0A4P9YD69_ROZAC|nr:ORMDL-domain-containing protein [Rozella allomycis CSF55]
MENTNALQNPNSEWTTHRGTWITNVVIVVLLKLFFSSIPGISAEASWTLLNVAYNLGSFIMWHWIMGSPFDTDQGSYRGLTLWEQLDDGEQFTPSKKFLTAFPIVLFFLGTHYTHYDLPTFLINLMTLFLSLAGKIPIMHQVRLFGINKKEE